MVHADRNSHDGIVGCPETDARADLGAERAPVLDERHDVVDAGKVARRHLALGDQAVQHVLQGLAAGFAVRETQRHPLHPVARGFECRRALQSQTGDLRAGDEISANPAVPAAADDQFVAVPRVLDFEPADLAAHQPNIH